MMVVNLNEELGNFGHFVDTSQKWSGFEGFHFRKISSCARGHTSIPLS